MDQINRGLNRPGTATGELLLLGCLSGLLVFSFGLLVWQSITPQAVSIAGVTVDRLSASLTLLVAAVGAATFRFSRRYLDGEPGRHRFLGWLCFTVATAYLLMLSTNLLLLFAAWSLTSFGLHRLLTFYPDRPEAQTPARKKFLISRLGDVALIAALVLIWNTWSTFDLQVFLAAASGPEHASVSSTVAFLIVLAALTKSAQFPFHSWLPETMESPTPVSALMHAGIINAGGALLLRFAPLLVKEPAALLILSAVGTLTATLAMLAMWAQTKVKRTLAWSTVSQMGFMMVQCGLCVFPAAALHIVGHGCYKAWSFLRSGDLQPHPSPLMSRGSPGRTLARAALGTIVSIPAMWLASAVTGFSPTHSPGEFALAAIIALSIGQLWVALLSHPRRDGAAKRVVGALLATGCITIGAFALYRGAGLFLTPVFGDLSPPTGVLAWIAAALPVVVFTILAVLNALLPLLGRSSAGRAFYVHALNGFYFGVIADRLVDDLWSRFQRKGVPNA